MNMKSKHTTDRKQRKRRNKKDQFSKRINRILHNIMGKITRKIQFPGSLKRLCFESKRRLRENQNKGHKIYPGIKCISQWLKFALESLNDYF